MTMPQPPVGGQFIPLEQLSDSELRAELEMWRKLWTWIPEEQKFYLSKIGETVRCVPRMGSAQFGVLLGTEWELKGVEIGVDEVVHDYERGKKFLETKVVKMPVSNILMWQFLREIEELEPDVPLPTSHAEKLANDWPSLDDALEGIK